jgi:hypothetical protein
VCDQQGGQKIFKTVELPEEYFRKPGEPDPSRQEGPNGIGKAKGGELKTERLYQLYDYKETRGVVSSVFHTDMHESLIVVKQTGERMGTATSILHYGGWVQNMISQHTSPAECPSVQPEYIHGNSLWRKIVKQRPVTQERENTDG